MVSTLFAICLPVYGADPIDGFRDLKFGMTAEDVTALDACSTSSECLLDLSGKIRYVELTYDQPVTNSAASTSAPPRLTKIAIDMGQYSDMWHQQLQRLLASSYRLTHDFTEETMNAFLDKKLQTLKAGYEDGQIVLSVIRRQFGNMILKVLYQNTTLAEEFVQQTQVPFTSSP